MTVQNVQVYTGCFMSDRICRHEIAWQWDASRFIWSVSCTMDLLDVKLHYSATRPFLYWVFNEWWNC